MTMTRGHTPLDRSSIGDPRHTPRPEDRSGRQWATPRSGQDWENEGIALRLSPDGQYLEIVAMHPLAPITQSLDFYLEVGCEVRCAADGWALLCDGPSSLVLIVSTALMDSSEPAPPDLPIGTAPPFRMTTHDVHVLWRRLLAEQPPPTPPHTATQPPVTIGGADAELLGAGGSIGGWRAQAAVVCPSLVGTDRG